ncbi:MAG TPA: hypothetical protein VM052_08240 [Candidatus Limnocylindrales bacterium]|nr:hypothetical protein [Candidatus Limnocylindrales bacterium]
MRDDLGDVFTRDIDRIELPPPGVWLPTQTRVKRSRFGPLLAIPTVAGVIALALAAAFVIQLIRGDLPPQVAKSPSPAPSAGASAPASPAPPSASSSSAPTAIASSTPVTLPTSSAVHVSSTVPSGQWALILQRNTTPGPGSGVLTSPMRDSIVAVSLGDGSFRPVLDFVSGAAGQNRVASNLLREQFSSDGHRLVLSVFDGDAATARLMLVIVDVVNGTVSRLTSDAAFDDEHPVWSPNGDQIAFSRRPAAQQAGASNPSGTIWVVRQDGTGLRQVLGPSAQRDDTTAVLGWNSDGSAIAYLRGFEGSPYYLVNVASGTVRNVSDHNTAFGTVADWRVGTPAFVGALMQGPYGSAAYLVTAGTDGSGSRDIVTDTTGHNSAFQGARWRPGSNDILYTRWEAGAGGSPTWNIFVTDSSGRAPRVIATRRDMTLLAAWTADGRDVVGLSATGVGGGLFLVAPDGTNERQIFSFGGAPESRTEWLQLAVLSL